MVFDSGDCGGSFILDKATGEKFNINEANGAYEISMDVFDEASGIAASKARSAAELACVTGFRRPGTESP